MLLCFVDESDQGDFHGFAGLIADEHATKAITDSLNRIVRQVAVDWGMPATTELHGHPIFHGKEDWKHVPTRVRVGVFHKFFEAVVAEDVVILLRWVHAARLAERQARNFYPVNFPPEQVCFQHILQRAQQVSVRRDTYTLTIADDRHDRDRHRERSNAVDDCTRLASSELLTADTPHSPASHQPTSYPTCVGRTTDME